MDFTYRSREFVIEGISESDLIYSNIVRTGTFYEIDLLEYIFRLRSFVRSKNRTNVVIDVGANIGNHSIYFASFVADHLIAVEPNPQVLPTLRANLARNVSDFSLFEYAVGENEGRGTVDVPEQKQENIGAARINWRDDDGGIQISTLDSTLNTWGADTSDSFVVSMIKIDVEGMEPQVLAGAKATIERHRPHIFLEASTDEELQRVQNILIPLGYKRLLGSWAATPVYHFAHQPTFRLRVASLIAQLRKGARKVKKRILSKGS